MASYPAWMPKPLQSGFSMQPEDRRIAQSTVGTSFSPGFGGDVCTADCTLRLKGLQAEWFEQWERENLVQGVRWFRFPLWYGGEIHWENCRFKTRPKLSGVSGKTAEYQFSLYVQKRSGLMPDCMVKLFACWPPCFWVEADRSIETGFAHLSHVTDASIAAAMEN